MEEGVTFRAVQDEDQEFLLRLYASSRTDLGMFGWDRAAEQAFLKMQFEMQSRSYAMQFPTALHSIIVLRNEPAGRLIVDQRDDAVSLVDITISPEFRSRGIGAAVIRGLQDEAGGRGVPLVLAVDRGNPRALELYIRLGFIPTEENEMTIWMRW